MPTASVEFPDATPADSADTTEGVHDPTIFKDPVTKHYFAYSSHNLVFESEDLINWEKHDYTKTVTVPKKAKEFIIRAQLPTQLIGHLICTIKRVTNIRIGSIFQHHADLAAETRLSALLKPSHRDFGTVNMQTQVL